MNIKAICCAGLLVCLTGEAFTAVEKQTNVPSTFNRGDQPLSSTQYEPNYSAPGSVKLNSSRDTSFLAEASYLLWYAAEDGLDIATTSSYVTSTGSVTPSTSQMSTVFPDFNFTSGFKLGVGSNFNFDDWGVRLDYTYYRRDAENSLIAPDLGPGVGVFYLTNWYSQSSSSDQAIAASNLSSKWHLGIDWIDLSLQRAFYQGKNVVITPSFGLRTALIRQGLFLQASNIQNVTAINQPVHSNNTSNSWGIGPRANLDMNWLCGWGFSVLANTGFSLLYTDYTKVRHHEDALVSGSNPISYVMENLSTYRPMLEAALGLAWGKYFKDNRYHLSVKGAYQFNYLWSQNMLRRMTDMYIVGTGAAPGDLYLSGLTLSAQLAF